jgi:serine/threonine protein kinase
MTATAMIVGTPTYVSPEQASGQSQIDHRADIYAFGVVAYEILAGTPPFKGDTGPVIMAAHLTTTPEPLLARRPDVPARLANLVMQCLEKRPEDRYQQAEDLLVELDGVVITAGANSTSGVRTREAGLDIDPALSPDGPTVAYVRSDSSRPGCLDGRRAASDDGQRANRKTRCLSRRSLVVVRLRSER